MIAHKVAVIRSILIGFFCGILPGIGATLAAFMGYNEAVRWSKVPHEFGKGKLEGVISSETANNAATGAAMIPLLATVGAYAVRGLVIDVVVMFVAGVLGFFLRRSGYSVAGIVLGLILGKIGEQTFAQAMQMLYFEWFGFLDRPIALGLIIAGAVAIFGSIYGAFFKKQPAPPADDSEV